MLDSTPIIHTTTEDWRDAVSHGDIVLFRFPIAEEESKSKSKARPCLILDVEEHGGQRFALLAYGTTSRRKTNIGYEVHVRPRAAYVAAGLDRPTRFVGARRLLVPLTHVGFIVSSATGSAVIGRIDGKPFEVMHKVRTRIDAMRDIAAERRAREGRRHGRASNQRTFVRCPHLGLPGRAKMGVQR